MPAAGSNEPDGVLSYQRPDEEAVVDQGGTSTILNIHYEKEELEGHRTLYVGVRMPLGRQSHRHHRTHGQKHRRRGRGKGASQGEEGLEALAHDTPSQRVQFILGTEEDEEHVPHELFTELDEICMKEGEDAEWKETARWLKFEEDVEDGGERWSKPYVATLSLHSLFELRSCLINGTVLLDMRANSIEEISDLILDQQELSSDLNDSMRVKVREALLKKHHHQNEKKRNNLIPIVRSFAEVGKKQSDPHSMDKHGQTVSPQSVPTTNLEVKNGVNCEHSPVDLSKVDLHFMKKIPTGAEASNVLVGEVDILDRPIVAFVRLSPAVLLSGLTEVPIPTRFLFILLGPVGKGQQYHEIGRSMATIMTDEIFHDVAYKAKERDDLLAGIDEFLDQVTVLPPGEWDPSIRIEPPKNVPSQEKRKMPGVPNGNVCHIEQEPHGGHSGPELQRTGRCRCTLPENPNNHTLQYWKDHNIVTAEVHWANLTVSECQEMHGEFMGSACGHHGPYTPDVLFWSCILFFTTFILSSTLKTFKTSRYFPTRVRSMVSDFAVFLTIFTMVIIDFLIGVPSPKLQVPSVFKPTRDDRGWIINPIGPNPWWTVIAAIIPALLCTILIFMDQQITAVIINRKEHKLKKGCGYHLDLLMVAIMLGVCSIMGLPWFVAATVLSITHVNSLKLESECSAPGEQPKFLGIREQRVTGLMIFVLMGCSVFMTAILKFIPMPVLYGVFLYMGVSSLQGIQFFDRLKLFGMPAKHQPDFIYLRHVPLRKVHLFTLIQLTCLVLLWVIKASPAAIVFPMMVLALVFVRKVMDLCFSKRELSWLDDLMPESKKKKLDDAKKKAKEEEEAEKMLEIGGDKFPLESRKLLSSPGKSVSCRCDPSEINISDEMPKTTVWKALSMNSGNAKEKSLFN
ncbi:electroneutral sodium bicarbonate exchanger 1 isoform X2 [Macaca thibetana thibetana]|uniref:electroneutral sodium bicarbonate exchanger 1 isoform X1 n=1 Tax=Macaca mulatta TaxID=9544 RepID=UPI0004E510E9|nr:electroneutral sodium bicarbonate exchanger 1 isoform X1 [Macaca mulatta]XP_015286425.2 electroneutral sodium bicarbonate exchanger 1 isoform X3 [Macaca fascicularis]XP_037853029.1 electroneutral sodium bicarbonate exchanger 1 isoform X3 [Chlorocebus sabaeus]XP_050604673.1 electroneutral sodium bicarbonate exchanger 1 isoform X2 [Macaca thibetana thibetana]